VCKNHVIDLSKSLPRRLIYTSYLNVNGINTFEGAFKHRGSVTYCIIFTAFSGLEASVPASNLDGAPDLRRALSLLSTNSWGSVNPGQSSLAHFVNTNHNSVGHPATTQAVNTSAGYWQDQHTLPQQERVVPFDLHNNGSQYQEFQLSKSPYETSFFDSGQMLSKSDGHFLFKT